MQIGFNEDEIRAFLPRDYRKQELANGLSFELKLRVTMTKGNYSYPLNPSWSTEEITTVLHFLSQVVKKHMRAKLDGLTLCKPTRHLKPLFQVAPEKQLDKALKKLAVFQPTVVKVTKQKIKDLYHLENKLISAKEIT